MLYSLKNESMTASKDNTQFPSTQHHSALGSVTFTLKYVVWPGSASLLQMFVATLA